MSVIIRLQNLPWSANALDIRQFFKGLSIPEGGVHIVGGEMGDAFIAFSTDEDARQAMMKDRGKLNEVQVRLLLSSRAEMQKVIETARQQSLLALQKAGAIPTSATVASLKTTPLLTPQPPVITTNSLQNILGTQLGAAPSFQTYQQQAGITLIPTVKTDSSEAKISSRRESNESSTRDRRRSNSRDRRRSRSRDRGDRSSGRRRRDRSRSRERDRKSGRQRSSRRSRSREHSRDRTGNRSRSNRNSKDCDTNSNNRFNRENSQKSSVKNSEVKDIVGSGLKTSVITPWNMTPTNAYETASGKNTNNIFNAQAQRINPLNAFATAPESGMRTNISNAYTSSPSVNEIGSQPPSSKLGTSSAAALPNFQNFSTTTSTTNNYSINFLSNPTATSSTEAIKPAFALQNPYTAALRAASSNSNSQDSNSSSVFSPNMQQASPVYSGLLLDKKPIASQQQTAPPVLSSASPLNAFAQQSPQQQTSQQQQPLVQQQQQVMQQPIAFANTNPYAQMYPNLFAQAAAAGTGIANPIRTNIQNSKPQDQKFPQRTGDSNDYKGSQRNSNDENDNGRSCSIKISNMCNGTTYSDLRKFFSGLFIPHNGIKMINDRDGIRTGVAYIQFSRSSCIGKAMIRNNTFLKTKRVLLEPVSDEEFQESEDSYKPHRDNFSRFNRNEAYDSGNRGNYDNRYDNRNSPSQRRDDVNAGEHFGGEAAQEPLTVLYIEDIPAMATELDIMKMFSVFTIFDILLTVSPGNRREFTAYVKFSREEEAKAALMEQSRHMIGHRKVRVRPAKAKEMEKAKEKLRLANEQLKKEEAAMFEATEKDACENDGTEDFNNLDDDIENDGDDRDVDDDDDLTIIGNEPDMNNENAIGDNNQNERSDIPNTFNAQATEEYKPFKEGPSDPRLRRQRPSRFADSNNIKNDSIHPEGDDNNDNTFGSQHVPQQAFNGPNFNPSFNERSFHPMNNMENNFIILKNCDYSTRINNVAQLMMSANLELKHIEPLRNERQMPSGEFIVEFTNSKDATTALNRFNNTTFRNRNLRVRDITPQEIADRIGKPFMNYFPGGGQGSQMPLRNFDLSGRGHQPNFYLNDGYMDGIDHLRFDNMNNNMNNRNRGGSSGSADDSGNKNFSPMMRGGGGDTGGGRSERTNFNNEDMYMDDDDVNQDIVDCDNENIEKSDNEDEIVSVSSNGPASGETSSIPEKFSRPGCVLAMENVPFKADLKDIIEFFSDFDILPDDIIRRFNDDGSPTGDARVAFPTPAKARAAFEAKRQHSIFNRTIYINTL